MCDGWPCKVQCKGHDSQLARAIGREIRLTFDMGAWARVKKRSDRVRVLMTAPHNGTFVGIRRTIPVLLTLDHGQGRVVYTSFHNHANASSLQRKLIRYLVSQPIRTAENIRAEMSAGVGGLGELAQRHERDASSVAWAAVDTPRTPEDIAQKETSYGPEDILGECRRDGVGCQHCPRCCGVGKRSDFGVRDGTPWAGQPAAGDVRFAA